MDVAVTCHHKTINLPQLLRLLGVAWVRIGDGREERKVFGACWFFGKVLLAANIVVVMRFSTRPISPIFSAPVSVQHPDWNAQNGRLCDWVAKKSLSASNDDGLGNRLSAVDNRGWQKGLLPGCLITIQIVSELLLWTRQRKKNNQAAL